MHKLNIAHRDLKPDNVFILDDCFKLGDFGFATNSNKLKSMCGTPVYMAPEILKGD